MQVAKASLFDYPIKSGVFYINNACGHESPFIQDISPMQARCNMESGDGGWTVLVKRTPDVEQRELFNRTWVEYENGFGNLSGEFWYGLKNMHCLTSREPMEVEVEVSKTDGTKVVLPYGNFRVNGLSTSYTLHVSDKQHEEAYDYLGYHNGMKFTTFDNDNDSGTSSNCATSHGKVGWWFKNCDLTLLTHMPHPELHTTSPVTYHYAELRVRPKLCNANLPRTCD